MGISFIPESDHTDQHTSRDPAKRTAAASVGRRVALRDSDGEGSFEPFCGDSAPLKNHCPKFCCAGAFPAESGVSFGNFCKVQFVLIG
ncbi:MAG: hypothetical protein DWI00_04590 [Planctomycetota bacterium]|nr:MAG: hypothetical protein DWI00_04590 [Planctomycetota bacterium]